MIDYDPLSPASKVNSAIPFRSLREVCPVHHHVVPDSVREQLNENPYTARPTDRFWSAFRYGDVREVLQDNDPFCSKDGIRPEWMAQLAPDGMLLWADEPAHIRPRQIANKAFLPRMVETRRARIGPGPRSVVLAGELPRNGAGKVVKSRLKKLYGGA